MPTYKTQITFSGLRRHPSVAVEDWPFDEEVVGWGLLKPTNARLVVAFDESGERLRHPESGRAICLRTCDSSRATRLRRKLQRRAVRHAIEGVGEPMCMAGLGPSMSEVWIFVAGKWIGIGLLLGVTAIVLPVAWRQSLQLPTSLVWLFWLTIILAFALYLLPSTVMTLQLRQWRKHRRVSRTIEFGRDGIALIRPDGESDSILWASISQIHIGDVSGLAHILDQHGNKRCIWHGPLLCYGLRFGAAMHDSIEIRDAEKGSGVRSITYALIGLAAVGAITAYMHALGLWP